MKPIDQPPFDTSRFEYLMVVDLEATCCEDQSLPSIEVETIEIGAIMLQADTFALAGEFCSFVRPVRHPGLTAFCTKLTSITQEQVDAAPVFAVAMERFKTWMFQYGDNILFASWGDFDRKQLQRESQVNGLQYPISAPHLNIKRQFSLAQDRNLLHGMGIAMKLCGLELEGTHHRAIDDVRNMARMMPFVFGREQIPFYGIDYRTLR